MRNRCIHHIFFLRAARAMDLSIQCNEIVFNIIYAGIKSNEDSSIFEPRENRDDSLNNRGTQTATHKGYSLMGRLGNINGGMQNESHLLVAMFPQLA